MRIRFDGDEDTTSENDSDDNNDNDDTSTESDGETEVVTNDGESETVTLTKAELAERDKGIRKDQDKRWKKRLKVGDDEANEASEEAVATDDQSDERYDRLELKTEGVTEKKEQDLVIELARSLKIPISEALKRPAIKAELQALRDKTSTPAPSRRTGAGANHDEIGYWVDQFKKGKSAPTSEMRRKVRKAMQTG